MDDEQTRREEGAAHHDRGSGHGTPPVTYEGSGSTGGEPDGGERGPASRALAEVTWGWSATLAGLLVAIAPIVLLTLLTLGADGGQETTSPTAGDAFVTVAVTAVLDGWYLLAAWFFSLRRGGSGMRAWGFRRPRSAILWAVPLALVLVYAVGVLYNLNVETKQQVIVEEFPRNPAGVVLFLVLACAVAPFFEETFFRGFLFQGFSKSWGLVVGGIVSAAIFALSHQQLDIFVPLFALGLALAWVFYISRSAWGSISLHAVYNLIAVIAWIAGA